MATITGTNANESLTGTSGNDTIFGLGGNDTLNGNGGFDIYDGGAGFDSIDLRTRTSSNLVINFEVGEIYGGGVLIGRFTDVERVQAGVGNDSLFGTIGGQNLAGQGGNDTLHGASGIDTLWGGSGNDHFLFREAGSANADTLGDFASGADKIVLDASVMTALGAGGNFGAGDARFAANASGTAQDASDRVIFETDTRQIWYDADGNGAGARQLIATLQSGATLVAADIVVEGSGPGPIVGTSGDDNLEGTDGDDTIDGLGGNDTLRGWEGADSIRGGDGNDILYAYHHALILDNSDNAADTLDGGLGDDVYYVGETADIILDAGGNDTVIAGTDWTLGAGLENLEMDALASDGTGNELDNRIVGSSEHGSIFGMGGDDTLIIIGETGQARGGDGDDSLAVDTGSAGLGYALFGDAGNDRLTAADADTTMDGGAGNDTLSGAVNEYAFSVAPGLANADLIDGFSSGASTIELDGAVHVNSGPSGRFAEEDARFVANSSGTAQDGADRVIYNTATGQLWYDADGTGAAARQLIATLQDAPAMAATDISVINGSAPGSVINGTSGNDTLSGTNGDDTINGLGGNDLVLAGSTGGADVIDGGAGNDSIEFKAAASSAVIVNFNAGTITGGSAGGTISFTGIERVVAGNFNDSLSGSAGSQNLAGQAGADTLTGGGGNDTLWGGTGNDAFVFNGMGTANADRISDFTSGQDKVQLQDTAFSGIGAMGNFAAGDARFWASSTGTAHDANDRVLYNTTTGQLYYDADGNGGGAAQLFATLTTRPVIAATDIAVI